MGNQQDAVRVANVVREVVRSAAAANTFLFTAGVVREVATNSLDMVRVAGLVREVVGSLVADTHLQVTGLVREVVMEGPPLVSSRVMAWRMGW